MSYSNLAALNNNAAAKRAAFKKTPYVPWNADEIIEPGFLRRIPFLPGNYQPKGWTKVREIRPTDYFNLLDQAHDALVAGETVGYTKIEHGVYKPLPEAHEPGRSEVR